MKKIGVVKWFDGGQGEIFCPLENKSYYVHYSAIKSDDYELVKNQPVEFALYTNLYMNQVDNIWPIRFDYTIENEHKVNRLMNELFEIGSGYVFGIEDQYYNGEI